MKASNSRLLIFSAFIFLLAIMLGFYYWISLNLKQSNEQSARIEIAMVLLGHLDKLNTSLTYIERNEKPHLIAIDTADAGEIRFGYQMANRQLDTLKILCENEFFRCSDIVMLDSLIKEKARQSTLVINLSKNGMPDSAIKLLGMPRDSLLIADFVSRYNHVYEHAKKDVDLLVSDHASLSKKIFGVIVFLVCLSILAFIFIFWRLIHNISKVEKLASQNQLFANIIGISSDSVIISDPDLNIIFCNPATEKLYKLPKEMIIGRYVDDTLWSDNTRNTVSKKNRSLKETGSWEGEIRRRDGKGKLFDLYLSINSFRDEKGKIAYYFAIASNITELKKSQHKIETLADDLQMANENLVKKVREQTTIIREVFERVDDVFIGTDSDLNIIYANSNVEQLFGLPASRLQGEKLTDLLIKITDAEKINFLNECRNKQVNIMFEWIHPETNQCFKVEMFPSVNGISLYFRDITLAKKAESDIQSSQRMYRFISEANDILLNAKDEQAIFRNICNTAIGSGGFVFSWIGIPDRENETINPLLWAGNENGYLKLVGSISLKDTARGRGPSGKAVREGNMYYCNDIANDPAMKPWREEALKRGYRSSIALPIKTAGKVVAVFTLYANRPDYFSPDEILLLLRVTENIGYALTSFHLDKEKRKAETQLQKVLQAIEQSSASVVITDLKGDIEYVNPAFTKLTGYTYEESIGKNPRILKTGHTNPDEYRNLWHNLTTYKEWHGEFCNKKKNGELYWEYAVISPIVNKQGEITNFIAVKENITERKKMQEDQKELVEIIDNTTAFIVRSDMNRKILYMNKAMRLALEYGADEDLSDMSVYGFMQDEVLNFKKRDILIHSGEWSGEDVMTARSGKQIPVLQKIVVHKDSNGKYVHASATSIDISGIKKAEEELRKVNEELKELAQHLQKLSELEKKNIAREIHDELGQYLTAMRMAVSWIQKHNAHKQPAIDNKLHEVQEIVTQTIASFKKIHSSLHPAMLEDVGLHAAVEWYVQSVEKYSSVLISFSSNMQKSKLSIDISLPLYRVVQECVTNIVRYSRATKASVILIAKDEHVYVKIKDNGIGFAIDEVDTKLHHGLLGMRERVYAIKGQIKIKSVIGKGTAVTVVVAVNNQSATPDILA